MANLKSYEHLLRLAAAFAVGLVIFAVARSQFVPRTFGQYGHYRAAAVGEIGARPVKFAGHQACEQCHTDVAEAKRAGPHARLNCEACHGAQARHAEDPAATHPPLPDTTSLCPRCHEALTARPKNFPQVASAEHASGAACKTCHVPHNPKLTPGEAHR